MKQMKRFTFLFSMIFVIANTYSQDYQISFAGTGSSNKVDSVKVENLKQGTKVLLGGNDILNLTSATGINSISKRIVNNLLISTNSATGDCMIEFEAIALGETSIEVYDLTGKRITHLNEILVKGMHTFSLIGTGTGIYILKVESNLFSYTTRFVSIYKSQGNADIKHIGTAPISDKQNVASMQGNDKSLKSNKSSIDMQYNTGDTLKISGKSDIYGTTFILVPTQNQIVTFNFVACTDLDGNNYSVVQIGSQIWMVENLKVTKYRNGDAIPNITDAATWNNPYMGAYCDFDNNPNNSLIYGKLYNWRAVNDARNIAPTGWHVPTKVEWTTLINYLGGTYLAGGKLKETSTSHWLTPNTGATNASGFTAISGGNRYQGAFINPGMAGYWWTSSTGGTGFGYCVQMSYATIYSSMSTKNANDGYSVRCIKD